MRIVVAAGGALVVEGSPLTPNRLEIYVDDRDRVEDVTIIRRTP